MEKILIHSYKGGTGKTTIAINMANLLSFKDNVLLIESDFIMPSFLDIFSLDPKIYFNDYLRGNATFTDVIVPDVRSKVDAIFTDKNFDPNEKILGSDQNWFLSLLERLIKDLGDLQEHYKYVIFDTPPGWHLFVVNLLMLVNKAILVLRPNSYAVNGTKRIIEILYKRARPVRSWDIYLLFNQVPEIDMNIDLERWVSEFQKDGIKYAGNISCSCATSYQMAHEAMIFPVDHHFSMSLQVILKRLFNSQ